MPRARARPGAAAGADQHRRADRAGLRATPAGSSTWCRWRASPAPGERLSDRVAPLIERVRAHTELPLLVGFGISLRPDRARGAWTRAPTAWSSAARRSRWRGKRRARRLERFVAEAWRPRHQARGQRQHDRSIATGLGFAACSVLVVEDDQPLVRIMTKSLESNGFDVDVAPSTARTGLRAARDDRPDAIVLDLQLPKLNGVDVCRRLRSDGNRVPILMLTAREHGSRPDQRARRRRRRLPRRSRSRSASWRPACARSGRRGPTTPRCSSRARCVLDTGAREARVNGARSS